MVTRRSPGIEVVEVIQVIEVIEVIETAERLSMTAAADSIVRFRHRRPRLSACHDDEFGRLRKTELTETARATRAGVGGPPVIG